MKLEGKYQTVEGEKAILQICNRMNNYRLTTYVKNKYARVRVETIFWLLN